MTRVWPRAAPIESVVFERQDDLTAALLAGVADGCRRDSPVTGFAIKTSGGALAPAGEIFDAGHAGYPVRRACRWPNPRAERSCI